MNDDELADKLVDKLVDKLLAKPLNLQSSLSLRKPGNLLSTHAQRMPPVRSMAGSMQAYSPYDGKKSETLSYLPQLTNDQIAKQIGFMLRNNWAPALEFSEDPDIYLNTRMGPGYYDNRYWSLYKLPMFGCSDPNEVVREIEACKREFPSAKIRVIAFDSKRQVQTAGFIVRK